MGKFKRIVSVILVLLLMFTMFLETGMTTLADTGAEDFIIEGDTLIYYQGSASEVTIPDGITTIGESAFIKNENITSVTMPKSLKKIDR